MKKKLSLTSIEPYIRFEIREGVAVFRLTDDIIDTVFHIRCHESGLPPIGGLAYFLPLYLGWGRAMRILLETTKIDAKQAFDLGIVDDVVATDDLTEISLTRARELAHMHPESIRGVKNLLNMHLPHLEASFDAESKIIATALNRFRLRKPE